jgi:hypothetical protein
LPFTSRPVRKLEVKKIYGSNLRPNLIELHGQSSYQMM